MSDKKEQVRLLTPVGRLINHALFEKDSFTTDKGAESKSRYKIEMVFDNDDEFQAFEANLAAAAVAEWGAPAEDDYWNGKIDSAVKDGDQMAQDRAARGKPGEAYSGKLVLRASTDYNRDGEDGPGGVYVCDANAKELGFVERQEVYRGCYGVASVTPSAYLVSGRRGVTLYLNGFQKVKDGERLRSSDPSGLFSPMMGQGSEAKGRRGRGK